MKEYWEGLRMKRFLAMVVVLATLIVTGAFAEGIDLSGMSYDELVALKDQIDLAIWSSEEWQEVEVPQGVWVIGEDIPAGKWCIKAADGLSATINWGDALDASGVDLSYEGEIWVMEVVYSENYDYYSYGDATEVIWDMKEGNYFIVSDGIALFTPYAGKPGLGFK